ncbi:2Fe-2S iron-sulfur cluster-binding protein [Streptomyces sp. NPDC059656]|uniref:2Fe-2S iron-sulfur cluster-binding protein n=1 Tax=Streptomyces sp. NPDC059656 TaxID=3346898 RepID=UPI0036C68410
MSGNENENVTQGNAGNGANGANGTAGWGWEPVPQGGEYDSDATAFVKLPQDMLDALGTGEPLAAPGHGYVPPPMIVPLGSATTDPSATGTWTIPVQWPEAGGSGQGDPGSAPAPTPAPVGGPIPASIPIPAAVAAAFAEAEPEQAQPPVHDPGATAEWRFQDEASTGQWAVPAYSEYAEYGEYGEYGGMPGAPGTPGLSGTSGLHDQQGDFRPSVEPSAPAADWSQAPATLPGGAPAPWAYPTQDTGALPGTLPGTDAAAAASAAAAAATAATSGRLLGGPGVGTAPRGPRVLGGPGVGTPLPEDEPAHPTPHDIEAAHGAAQDPAEGARASEHADFGGHAGFGGPGGHAGFDGHAEYGGQAGHGERAEHGEGAGYAGGADRADHTGHVGHTGHTGHAGEAGHAEGAGHSEHVGHTGHIDLTGLAGLAEGAEHVGQPGQAEYTGHAGQTGHMGHTAHSGHTPHSGHTEFVPPSGSTDGRGFDAFGHAAEPAPAEPLPVPVEAPAAAPAADAAADAGPDAPEEEPRPESAESAATADADEAGPVDTAPSPTDAAAPPAPDGDAADSALSPPAEDPTGGVPAEGPSYEEENEHPQASYVLRVNGADRPVTGAWIGESLLYVLRERLGLAGAKDGCSQGECGACAVQVDGRLVASCLVPAATAAGSEVRTVEGLATDGELSDVQQALCRSGAVQCGFCVPGMAMTIHDLLEGNHAPSELETRQALCGNLCRCSGYSGVVDAVREVVAEREATAAAEAAAPGSSEPRIPHQAAPGEGGIHHGGTA